jgi:triosephosphate isomerase
MRKPFIAGNWKMNKTIKEAIELANSLKRELVDLESVDILICPSFTALSEVSDIVGDSNIKLGAQDVCWEEQGAFTGAVSSLMLKDLGCSDVIVGHSERRKIFLEDNQIINKKLKAVQKQGLRPIFCLGETLAEREADKTFEVIKLQLEQGLEGLSGEEALKLIIAYEPVWAIGTGKTATPDMAQEVHSFIRSWLSQKYSKEVSENLRILYGGSVKPDNTKELIKQVDIDGALVGGASLDSSSFTKIVKNSVEV